MQAATPHGEQIPSPPAPAVAPPARHRGSPIERSVKPGACGASHTAYTLGSVGLRPAPLREGPHAARQGAQGPDESLPLNGSQPPAPVAPVDENASRLDRGQRVASHRGASFGFAERRSSPVDDVKGPLCGPFVWSGRPDSNRGPLVPQTSALTRLRHAPLGPTIPAFSAPGLTGRWTCSRLERPPVYCLRKPTLGGRLSPEGRPFRP